MSVPEITPAGGRIVSQETPRLNLMIPSLNPEHYFGGIHTAMEFYHAMVRHFPASRIILTDSHPREEALSRARDHVLVDSQADDTSPRQVVSFCDRYEKPLSIGRGDVFLATAWWTAYAAQSLVGLQKSVFGTADRIAYLIQDFEPGFYAWSSRYALALSTYRPDQDIAIFNTRLLADYTSSQGLGFKSCEFFEPVLNEYLWPALRSAKEEAALPRRKRIVLYARPSTPRNAFELICEAVSHWSVTFPGAEEWEVVAPGELSFPIALGSTTLHGLGKLSVDAYGDLLKSSAVGMSLMVSPHPSYPPLEMAAFGLETVVNRFANKNLGTMGVNVHSVGRLSPEALSAALAAACAAAQARGMRPHPPATSVRPGYLASSAAGAGIHSIAARVAEALVSPP
jgi:hypothetical protein